MNEQPRNEMSKNTSPRVVHTLHLKRIKVVLKQHLNKVDFVI